VKTPSTYLAILLFLIAASMGQAQDAKLPDVGEPLLRLEAGGPTGQVTALAFAPDGQTLYAAGWDKIVRVWQRDPKTGEFVPQHVAYRVPLGPGVYGAINAMALSSDGKWLAVGGVGAFRGQSGFRRPGLVVPPEALTPEMREDQGTIFVFATAKPGIVRTLRGHRGPILSLAFVPAAGAAPPALISVGRGWDEKKGEYIGEVRAWELGPNDTALAQLSLPDPDDKVPGVAAWRTGNGRDAIQAALAWEDGGFNTAGKLRIWDVARQRLLTTAEGGFNNTVAYLGPNRLLTGSWLKADNFRGRLQAWQLPAADALLPGPQIATFLPGETTALVPRALGLVSANPTGQYDHAAVVLRVAPTGQYRLALIPLGEAVNVKAENALHLWDDGTRIPVVATAPRGAHVAVAGNPDHAIHVYAVSDLLQPQKKPTPLLLRSIGAHFGQAALVRKGQGKQERFGLILSGEPKAAGAAPRPPQKDDVLLDMTGRQMETADGTWQLDAPQLAGWSVAPPVKLKDGMRLTVTSPAGTKKDVSVAAGRVTDYALMPPHAPLNVPLLAVASADGDEPALAIFHAETGEQLCQLAGHLGPIQSLAFSADGRFLVSAATDQTVCLWTLIDLKPSLGTRGQLRGVILQKEAKSGRLTVASVAPDSPAAEAGLAQGDQVDGIVSGGKLRTFASAPEFYEGMLQESPGRKVTLRLGRKGDVPIPVSQAAQERTPLVLLFVTRDHQQWLAWNPLGPYDSSTPKMAHAFGWHFSTGKPNEPVQFTPGDADRAKERREGLLKHIVTAGSLVGALKSYEDEQKARPLPPPTMLLDVDDMVENRVQQPRATVRLHVDSMPTERIKEMLWAVDDGKWQLFRDIEGAGSTTDCTQPVQLPRGLHKLRVVLRTNEEVPQEFVGELSMRYAPPPPQVEPRGAAKLAASKPLATEADRFLLEAAIRPGLEGEKVTVIVYQQNRAIAKLAPKDGAIQHDVRLAPGPNAIAIVAVHQGALPGAEDLETGRLGLEVVYTKPPEKPYIALDGIVPLVGGKERADLLTIQPDRPVVVMVPQVSLVGAVKAERALSSANWRIDKGESAALAGFRPDTAKELTLDQPLQLHPGLQTVTVRARAGTGKEAEASVTIEYRPALPRFELAAQPAGPVLYDEGEGAPTICLHGAIVLPRDPAPDAVKTSAVVSVNGKTVPATIDMKALDWRAETRLQPGPNRIQVQVRNDWQSATHGDLQLTWLRPPHRLRATPAKTSDKPAIELHAEVESALPVEAHRVRGTVGTRALGDFKVTAPAAGSTYTIHTRVPLEPGANEVRLEVGNADGPCRAPGLWTVTYVPPAPPPPPPVVVLLEPEALPGLSESTLPVSRSDLPLRFRVRSSAPLTQVLLTQKLEGAPPKTTAFDLTAVEKIGAAFEMTGKADLKLTPGLTLVRVEAVNEGGTGSSPALLIHFLPPPVRLVLDSLQAQDGSGPLLRVSEKADGALACESAATARLVLNGRVAWYPADAALQQPQTINVYVNGSHQWRGTLDPVGPGKLERTFKADILLNRAKGNEIEVELPGLRLPDHQQRRCRVDCTQPLSDRWLHVQIISPGEANVGKLVSQVAETLGADPPLQVGSADAKWPIGFQRPGFAQGRVYGPLAGDAMDEGSVILKLLKIKHRILERAKQGWPNDVVLIYFVGGEVVDDDGRFAALVHGTPRRPLVSRQRLEKAFADTLGVKLLLLDVVRDPTEAGLASKQLKREIAQWLDTPTRHAWMRSTWLEPTAAAPPQARLLAVLQKTLPAARNLGDVETGNEQQFTTLARKYNALRADSYLPPALRALVLQADR
jgi:WD40 repeat protein